MTDTDHAEATRLLAYLAHEARHAPGHIRTDAAAWLKRQRIAQRIAQPERVLFDPGAAHNFVWLGHPDNPQCVPHPGLAGILDAWTVFTYGLAAGVLTTDYFDASSANALRERFTAAAEWADNAGAPALARCIRAIGVRTNGSIRYTRPLGIDLVLSLAA